MAGPLVARGSGAAPPSRRIEEAASSGADEFRSEVSHHRGDAGGAGAREGWSCSRERRPGGGGSDDARRSDGAARVRDRRALAAGGHGGVATATPDDLPGGTTRV